MNNQDSLSCPVAFATVNENKIRLIALQVFILGLTVLLFQHVSIIILLIVDFSARSFDLNKFSPLALISAGIIRLFSIGVKPINQGPKRFAARIGLIFSVGMVISHFTGFTVTTLVLVATLTAFSFLEAFLSFCAGCYAYTFIKTLSPD